MKILKMLSMLGVMATPAAAHETVTCGTFWATEIGPLACERAAMTNAAEPWNRQATAQGRQAMFDCSIPKAKQAEGRKAFYVSYRPKILKSFPKFNLDQATEYDWGQILTQLCPPQAERTNAPHQ